jgi:hypothetical protein
MDGGSTWTYIDPFRDMHDFCCDQDVVYDPNHQIFIWYSSNNNTNTNSSSSSTTQLQSTWKMQPAMHGTNGPSHNDWGDYLRVRPYSGSNLNWIASGYTLQGGSTEDFIQPLYLVFGPKINATNMNSSVRESALIPNPNAPTNPNDSSVTNDQLSSNYSSFTQSRSDSWNLQGKVYFEGAVI